MRRSPIAKRSKSKASTLRRKCDELMSLWVRRSNVCMAHGEQGISCSNRLETCHLKSRNNLIVRFEPMNVVPMCNLHHRFYTEHPDLWTKFVESRFPGLWDGINERILQARKDGEKVDYSYWLTFYQDCEFESWLAWHTSMRGAA